MFGFLDNGAGRFYQARALRAPVRTGLSQAYYEARAYACCARPQLFHDIDTDGCGAAGSEEAV